MTKKEKKIWFEQNLILKQPIFNLKQKPTGNKTLTNKHRRKNIQ